MPKDVCQSGHEWSEKKKMCIPIVNKLILATALMVLSAIFLIFTIYFMLITYGWLVEPLNMMMAIIIIGLGGGIFVMGYLNFWLEYDRYSSAMMTMKKP